MTVITYATYPTEFQRFSGKDPYRKLMKGKGGCRGMWNFFGVEAIFTVISGCMLMIGAVTQAVEYISMSELTHLEGEF